MTAIVTTDEVFALLGNSTPTKEEVALLNILKPMAEDAVREAVGYSITQDTYTHFLPEMDDDGAEVDNIDVVNDRVAFEYRGATNKLFAPERPIRSITSLYRDSAAYGGQGSGDFGSSTLQTSGTDYYVDYVSSGVSWNGLIVSIAGTWPTRSRTIKLTYVAGLTAGELAGTTAVRGPSGTGVGQLKYAALLAASLAFKEPESIQGSNTGPITAERLADYSVQYSAKDISNIFGFKQRLPEKVLSLLEPFKRYRL